MKYNISDSIEDFEFYSMILDFQSFISLVLGRKINEVQILTYILENPALIEAYSDYMGFYDSKEAILLYLKHNPKVCRSKSVKSLLISFNERKRKSR